MDTSAAARRHGVPLHRSRPEASYPDHFPLRSEDELATFAARTEFLHTYFDHDRERHARQHRDLFRTLPSTEIGASREVSPLDYQPQSLPRRLRLDGTLARYLSVPPIAIELDQLLELVGTRGLMVWHDGAVVHEEYRKGHDATTPWVSNSATKVITAMLLAKAVQEGYVSSLDAPLATYWPELADTAWQGATFDHCLTMRTGIDFVEEDLDLMLPSDYGRLSYQLAFGSLDAHLLTLGRRAEPGSTVAYASADTEALGGALIRAVGDGLARQLETAVWQPAGMAHAAHWITDPTGRELALGGWCATLPDFLRVGLVLLHHGQWNGQQILPPSFGASLARPDEAMLDLPGHDDYPLMTWNQAFVPSDGSAWRGDYMAAGSYGQIIYVNPATGTVVAHQGIVADITTEYIDLYRLFMAFRAISERLVDPDPDPGTARLG